MTSRSRNIFLWLLIVFVGVPIFFGLVGYLVGGGQESDTSKVAICELATQEDLENISSGMSEDSYSVNSGFVSSLPASEIDKVTRILPSYTNPRIVTAYIDGVSDSKPIGLWAIQQVTDGGTLRITALNASARDFSVWGTAANEGSAAAQLRDQLLASAESTNLAECIDNG
jgi:hypothetical protein